MNRIIEITLLTVVSIIYFIIFPINSLFSTVPNIPSYLIILDFTYYIIFWLIPVCIIFRIKKYSLYAILILFNIVLFWYQTFFFPESFWENDAIYINLIETKAEIEEIKNTLYIP